MQLDFCMNPVNGQYVIVKNRYKASKTNKNEKNILTM